MKPRPVMIAAIFLALPLAARAEGNSEAGKNLVLNSCATCHARSGTTVASDAAPPLSFMARDTKRDPVAIRAFLTNPDPPAPSILLSRQQIDDVIAYLQTPPSS